MVTKNFWDIHGDLLVVKEFRSLWEGDRSEGKVWSSNVMWAIYYIWDYGSRYFVLPEDERRRFIEKNLLGVEGFFESHWDDLGVCVEVYRYLQKDSEYRYLDTWQETVEARRLYIERLRRRAMVLSEKQPEKAIKIWEYLDKMLVNSKAILSQKDEIMERINKSGEGKVKGGVKLSLLAKGILNKGLEQP